MRTVTYGVSGYIEKVQQEHQEIQKIKEEQDILIKSLVDVLDDTVNQFLPLVNKIKELGYAFNHSGSDYVSVNAPILFVDKKAQLICELSIEDEEGKLIDLSNYKEIRSISYYEIVEQGYFEEAIAAIQNVKNNMVGIYSDEAKKLNKLRNILSKY